MLKNLKYIVAVGLIALGYTNAATAGFFSSMSCTASKGKAGGAAAHSCIEETQPGENPNFLAAFNTYHCQKGRIRAEDKTYCKQVQSLVGEHQDNLDNEKKAKVIKKNKANQKARISAQSKARGKLEQAKYGKAAKNGKAAAPKGKKQLMGQNGKKINPAQKVGGKRVVQKGKARQARGAQHPAAHSKQAVAKRNQRAHAKANHVSFDDALEGSAAMYGEEEQEEGMDDQGFGDEDVQEEEMDDQGQDLGDEEVQEEEMDNQGFSEEDVQEEEMDDQGQDLGDEEEY